MHRIIPSRFFGLFLLLAALTGLSCDQYEYASPTPGVLEVRLAVKNTINTNYIPFGTLDSSTGRQNQLAMILNELVVKQPGDIRQEIFASLSAIRRNPDGDIYNCLDFGARDSVLLLGMAYVPPGDYEEFTMSSSIGQGIFVDQGDATAFFDVVLVPPYENRGDLHFQASVREGKTTRVTITFDLDRALIRRAEDFSYSPYFYVSSVQEF